MLFKVTNPIMRIRQSRCWPAYGQESTRGRRAATGFCAVSVVAKAVVMLLALSGTVVVANTDVTESACPDRKYPLSSSPQLHISPHDARELLAGRQLAPQCRELAADLAQLYFWGSQDVAADLGRAWHFAQLSQREGQVHSQLRLLASAFSLAGLNSQLSVQEALRRFDRELRSGDGLRRDKAYAVLNHLHTFFTPVDVSDQRLFADAARRQASDGGSEALLLNPKTGSVLVANPSGGPSIRWLEKRPSALHQPGAIAATHEMFYPRGERAGEQRWQRWDRASASGVLYSGFGFANGDYKETRCTATTISPRWLVTAAHCLFASDADIRQLGEARVEALRFAAHHPASPTTVTIDEAWIHRRHRAADLADNHLAAYSGSDIALLRLARPLPDSPAVSLAALAGQSDVHVRSSGFPKDKSVEAVWVNDCRAGLVRTGKRPLMDLYAMNCPFSVGQSGSLMTVRGGDDSGRVRSGKAVGVLSANLSTAAHKSAIFAAFNAELLADIQRLVEQQQPPRYLMRRSIAEGSIVTTAEASN